MRDIAVKRLEFDEFLWPIVTTSNAESDKERAVALDVLRLLSDEEYTEEVPLTDAQIAQSSKNNTHVWNSRRLIEDEYTFVLEEEAYRLIRKRLQDASPKVSIVCLADFSPLLDRFNDAKKYKAEKDEPAESEGEPEKEAG